MVARRSKGRPRLVIADWLPSSLLRLSFDRSGQVGSDPDRWRICRESDARRQWATVNGAPAGGLFLSQLLLATVKVLYAGAGRRLAIGG